MDFSNLTIDRLLEDSKSLKIKKTDQLYINSYPHILQFFEEKIQFNESDIIQGLHMVYAWMPTTLKSIDWVHLPFVVSSLNALKHGTYLHEGQLEVLKRNTNNSLVGSSKLLHFISPDQYAIWDSKVIKYITGNKSSYGVNKVDNYVNYLDKLYQLIQDDRFQIIQHEVNSKMGYEVSKLRAAEVVMFMSI